MKWERGAEGKRERERERERENVSHEWGRENLKLIAQDLTRG